MSQFWNLFRYRPVNEFLWQELEMSELYCCGSDALNDPWDCRLDWRASLARAQKSVRVDTHRQAMLHEINTRLTDLAYEGRGDFDVGLACFTCEADSHLMWAHYANSHRGVCLLYRISLDDLLDRYPSITGSEHEFYMLGGAPVNYGDNAFFDWLVDGDLNYPHHGFPDENALTRLFCTKAAAWKYEKEFRIVMRKSGRIELPPNSLAQVIFGAETPAQHVRLVSKMAKRSNSKVQLSHVRKSPDSDFGMIFPELAVPL